MQYTKKIRVEIYKLLATTNCNVTKLCTLVGIDRSTYYKWHNDYEDFRDIVKYARAEFRSIKRESVISALYRRAMGYTVTEVKETVDKILEDRQTKRKTVYYKKHIPPCYKSMMFVLKHFGTDGFEIPDTVETDTLQCTQGVISVEDNLSVEEISIEEKIIEPEIIKEEIEFENKIEVDIIKPKINIEHPINTNIQKTLWLQSLVP